MGEWAGGRGALDEGGLGEERTGHVGKERYAPRRRRMTASRCTCAFPFPVVGASILTYPSSFAHGPSLHQADYIGLDTCLFILEGWVKKYPNEPAFIVPSSLRALVQGGKLGRKSGEGFYVWEGDKKVKPAM